MWTTGGAILRDLSRAQGAGAGGRGLHAELRALRPRDRPPPPPRWLSEGRWRRRARAPRRAVRATSAGQAAASEETEEYVRGLGTAAAGDGEDGPDLRYIQQMLDMVRKLNIAEEIVYDAALLGELDSYCIERSRSTPLCTAELAGPAGAAPAAAPATAPRAGPARPDPNKHKKRRRNIALESILEALENNCRKDAVHCTSELTTLLKPEDLITKYPENIDHSTGGTDHKNVKDAPSYDKTDSNDEVNHWMNQMRSPTQTNSPSKQVLREAMRLDPSSMFKKKLKIEVAKPSTKLNCQAPLRTEKCPGTGSSSYVPSAEASLCYQRYLENYKLVQLRREEASQLAALITEAFERAAQAEATELAALEETSERASLEKAADRAAQAAAPNRSALEEAPERAALAEAWERTARAESGVARAVRAAPAGARLAAPRACLRAAPCPVCAAVAGALGGCRPLLMESVPLPL